jgi:hypothetical protein
VQIAYDYFTTSEEEATARAFEQLAGSVYPGIQKQQALDKLCADYSQLRRRVYSQVSMACHGWKNAYFSLRREMLRDDGHHYTDVWELLEKASTPEFSEETWMHYRPLFDEATDELVARLDDISKMYGDILPPDFRELLIGKRSTIHAIRSTYVLVLMDVPKAPDRSRWFGDVFRDMIQTLAVLSREADRREAAIYPGSILDSSIE